MNIITIEQLTSNACNYWSSELSTEAAEQSTLMPLLQTQDIFLSILITADANPYIWQEMIKFNEKLSSNLFLKHLMVLSDIGGERLQRFSKDFHILFPTQKLEFSFKGEDYCYEFKSIKNGTVNWSNKKLRVEKSLLLENSKSFTNEMLDVAMLLLWGADCIHAGNLPDEILEKCVIGSLIGKPDLLKKYVKERYLYVSRQTGGSTANDLGYACERHIKKKLSVLLPDIYEFNGHTLANVTQNDRNLTKFDLIVTNTTTRKSIGIEISFQVTTNSVIERKAQNAKNRQQLAHNNGHKVAYIIDGSGNFQRKSAINTILQNSDCTVNFSDDGLIQLAQFIKDNI
ncbi:MULTISPECIES: hypothetical protein [Neisseria]|uniref:hypothetical protein n=1 Tax=Neisseria TaxID=482 RepID=UPI00359FA965